MFESGAKVRVVFHQRPRDAVPDRSCLTRWTTTLHVNDKIKLIRGLSQLQRLTNDHPQSFVGEVAIERFVVDLNFAGSGSQVNSGRCRFAPPRSVILNFSHSNFLYLLLKLVMSWCCELGRRLAGAGLSAGARHRRKS